DNPRVPADSSSAGIIIAFKAVTSSSNFFFSSALLPSSRPTLFPLPRACRPSYEPPPSAVQKFPAYPCKP
ncbi:hypothetical protein A2U01_0085201, partial [Trifolium medium]|nr:hypothetical protein [Trifolium medium]